MLIVHPFVTRQEGSITVLSILLLIAMLLLAGLGLDAMNGVRSHTQLQNAADSAGQAAIYWRQENSRQESISKAIEVAEDILPTSFFGTTLSSADVEFGTWDATTRVFTPDAASSDAVRVTTRRLRANGNAVRTFLLKLVGVATIDLNTASVWIQRNELCDGEAGFFGVGIVDMQSNNQFMDRFCVHSETRVEFNQNNEFEKNTTVSAPRKNLITVPGDNFSKNKGLEDARSADVIDLQSIIDSIPDLKTAYEDPFDPIQESYITSPSVNKPPPYKKSDKIGMADLSKNAVNILRCNGGTLTLAGEVISDVVIVTDCAVDFSNGSELRRATLVTSDTSAQSIKGSSGLVIGDPDFCTDGMNKTTIVTAGGFQSAAQFKGYGASILAAGDVSISAQADGLAGLTVIAGGRIDNTSNNSMGNCAKGGTNDYFVQGFKMVD